MSGTFDPDDRIWVGDLDGYVYIGGDPDWDDDPEEDLEESEEDESAAGVFPAEAHALLQSLRLRGLSTDEWTWAEHQARGALNLTEDAADREARFVKDLLSLGRRYAIARYARWERLFFPAALAATLPHGLAALVDQFMQAQGLAGDAQNRDAMRAALRDAARAPGLTAYGRTGLLRSAIHRVACNAWGPTGYLDLGSEAMRTLLSLARLHHSVAEIGVRRLEDLAHLDWLYQRARHEAAERPDERPPILGRHVPRWRLRHLRPLTDLYPIALREAIRRALRGDLGVSKGLDSDAAVQQLALARCEIILMRRQAKERPRA